MDPLASRLVGAALIGIGGISLVRHNASLDSYRSLLGLKLIWSFFAVIGILITMLYNHSFFFGWLILVVFAVFFLIWGYYYKKLF